MIRTTLVIVMVLNGGLATWSRAADLPYGTRTKPYSGFSSSVRGDLRTVTMAGAVIGLADSEIAALDNPAGLALSFSGASLMASSNWVRDGWIQNPESRLISNHWSAGLSLEGWGFGLTYFTPYREGQDYTVSGAGLSEPSGVNLQLELDEVQFSVARNLWKSRFAVGGGVSLGKASALATFPNGTEYQSRAWGAGAVFGIQARVMPERLLVGLSFSSPRTYSLASAGTEVPGLPGYFQPVLTPWKMGFGMGWVPNRFFMMDASLLLVGTTPGAALLRDESIEVGRRLTVQPRFGFSYRFLEHRIFRLTLLSGLYVEFPRFSPEFTRWHGTAGVQAKVYVFNLGWGMDAARDYKNFLATISLDLVGILERAGVIPWVSPVPQKTTTFPHWFERQDEGVSPALLSQSSGKEALPLDPIDAARQLPDRVQTVPKNLQKEFRDTRRDLQDASATVIEEGKEIFQQLTPSPVENPVPFP